MYFERQFSLEAYQKCNALLEGKQGQGSYLRISLQADLKYKTYKGAKEFMQDLHACLLYACEDEPHTNKPAKGLYRRARSHGFGSVFMAEWNRLVYWGKLDPEMRI